MYQQEVVIVPYRDGPYLVRGPVSLRDQNDTDIDVTRRTIALCRCGKSMTRPFCDGTHRLVGFRAPSQPEHRPSPRPASGSPDRSRFNERDDRDLPRWHDPARRRYEVARAKLVRASAKMDPLLDAPVQAETHVALRTAQSLIVGARLLLTESAAQPEPLDETPCLCLITEALVMLRSVPATPELYLADLVALLTAVTTILERRDPWR
jgi:CDGSH-type Zn-finger protein